MFYFPGIISKFFENTFIDFIYSVYLIGLFCCCLPLRHWVPHVSGKVEFFVVDIFENEFTWWLLWVVGIFSSFESIVCSNNSFQFCGSISLTRWEKRSAAVWIATGFYFLLFNWYISLYSRFIIKPSLLIQTSDIIKKFKNRQKHSLCFYLDRWKHFACWLFNVR